MKDQVVDWLSRNRLVILLVVLVTLVASPAAVYQLCRINVPERHVAVLIKKTGKDIPNDSEIAPSAEYKGVQREVLNEGRYFYNPYKWDWEVVPMVEISNGELGIKIRLEGDDLPYGEVIAWETGEKGVEPDVLRPGRYAINPYVHKIERHKPITIPAGFKGVRTLLNAEMPADPNVLLVEKNKRGVQKETLPPGTYYVNPYVERINLVDCRSKRFNLAQNADMGFPSKDGFLITLDGRIEYRINPERASEVFVTYNDEEVNGDNVEQEIVNKIIMPNARSFCRLRGSDKSGREFINGKTRIDFQKNFQEAMKKACEPEGIEVIQALITEIQPPQQIADPVRLREVSKQELQQYVQQTLQQQSEIELAREKALIEQRKELIKAEEDVIKVTTKALEEQGVELEKAAARLKVAEERLAAAKDKATAIVALGKADAQVIDFNNAAEAAGWKKAVEAFGGDGNSYATYVLNKVLAPAYGQIMVNTNDSPLMEVFKSFVKSDVKKESK